MPRLYGTPSSKAAAILKTREDFALALRSNDQKALSGISSDEDGATPFGMLDLSTLFPGVQVNRFNGFGDYLVAGSKKVWAAMLAADTIANTILSTDMRVVWRDPEKNKAGKKVKVDPELLRLLQNPNPHDTISEMMYLWACHMLFVGNVYWFKDEMNGYGQPKNIYWLSPRHVNIVPDAELRVRKYVYRVNGREIEFTPDEIIHFKRPNPTGSLFGLGQIESGESLFDEHINEALFSTRFMANGAMPSSVLVNETFQGSQDDWTKLRDAFMERYGGVKNAGKVAWLNGKWSLLTLGLDAARLQKLERSKLSVEQILMNFGVPLSVAGMGSANYATAHREERNFRKYAVLPKLNLFTDKVNSPHGFITAFTEELKLDFSLSGIVDIEQVMKDNGPLFDRGGLTPNDLRELCGMPRKSDPLLDQHFIQSSYVPLEIAGVTAPTETELDGATKPKPDKKPSSQQDTGDGTPAKPRKMVRVGPDNEPLSNPDGGIVVSRGAKKIMLRRIEGGYVAEKVA